MRRVWIGLAVVVATIAVAFAALHLAGSRMPETHVAEGSSEVAKPPSGVATRIRDVASQPRWRPSVTKIEILADEAGAVRYRETGKNGVITYAFREVERDRLFESRIDDDTLAFGGRWLITVAPAGTGTLVTIREEGLVKPPIFRVLSKHVFGHQTSLRAYLDDLKTP